MAAGHPALPVARHSARAPIGLGRGAPPTELCTPKMRKTPVRSTIAPHADDVRHAPHIFAQRYSFGHSCPPLLCGTRVFRSFTPQLLLHASLLAPLTRVNRRA